MEKINIAELLRNCPKGMELDCTMYENLEFSHIDEKSIYPIKCRAKITDVGYNSYEFTKNGQPNHYSNAKCVIFPKGKTTWKGFHRPFVEGDVVSTESGMYIGIVKSTKDNHEYCTFCSVHGKQDFHVGRELFFSRLATEDEKAKLFQAIKDNGYHWNIETKTLEKLVKPNFKVGDRIILKDNPHNIPSKRIKAVTKNLYILENEGFFYIDSADKKYVLENKFNITTLKPFESRVLVRNTNRELWKPAIYGFSHSKGCFVVGGVYWAQCIPYDVNKELLGTANDCNNFFVVWEES